MPSSSRWANELGNHGRAARGDYGGERTGGDDEGGGDDDEGGDHGDECGDERCGDEGNAMEVVKGQGARARSRTF
ncbi:hypothetical protein EXIGLDRAFT_759442 [Exidia glandulosa HHB12029]|uniref:Uncharacterized protein n=1 Tax=Exidia glandulosa HHB12029 TaxID=1314781 RepID=A0A165Q621_EXIGL|nr:hypothetical protein EXIGLDRAFT_759442 [Exidia glandulosa HHB12029]